MSQKDVCDWLAANLGWHPTAEVVSALNQGYTVVRNALALASIWRDIESRKAGFRKEWRART